MKHLPNTLTIGRIVITPLFLWCMLRGTFGALTLALSLFILATLSDYWDGKLARKYKAGSRLGKFLDPLADKILVLGAFLVLPFAMTDPTWIPMWAVMIIVVRDLLITGLRMYAEWKGFSVETLNLAKTKTTIQFVFLIYVMLFLVLTKMPFLSALRQLADAVLYSPITLVLLLVVVAITAYTGILYLNFWRKRT